MKPNPTDEQRAAQLIAHARWRLGLSQRAFAELVGISQPALSVYESGSRQPTLPKLLDLLRKAGFELRMELTTPPPRADWEIAMAEDLALMRQSQGIPRPDDPA